MRFQDSKVPGDFQNMNHGIFIKCPEKPPLLEIAETHRVPKKGFMGFRHFRQGTNT